MRTRWTALLVGLVLSGVAGIVNQVVWQRALKIFLGGSETLSSMVVVLVFLLGLGVGAAIAGRFVGRLRDPLRALGAVELSLAGVNVAVAGLLALDLTETVYTMQRLTVASGVPLRVVYAVGSAALLSLPTMLMGATVPLASEGCQRQLGATHRRLVPALFFVNTVGAAVGALGASAWLLPALGQRLSLGSAAGLNALAGLLILTLARAPAVAPAPERPRSEPRGPTRDEWLGGLLGFLSLGYEMALFRVLALAHLPLPTTFATGLAGFLLAWSIGVAIAGRLERGVPALALATGAGVAAVPALYAWEVAHGALPLSVAVGLYVLPCVGFGALYGLLVSRAARSWGRDVGRYTAINTLGSGLGIVAYTLGGYELPQSLGLYALAAALLAIAALEAGRDRAPGAGLAGAVAALGLSLALCLRGLGLPWTEADGVRAYWGRDGVVEVNAEGNVWIDGLWHTRLTDGEDHVGRPYSWVMALAAALAHEGRPRRALVVGAGVGITGVSLAGIEGLQIDGYEINHTLKRVLRDYPEQTLGALHHPRLRWIWQDARTGLALDETRYDLLLSAPLHLRQAGSSLLLSREYLRLAKSRLAPGGVLAVYSNEGSPAQTRLVQATLAELFPHRVTWYDGVVTVVSDHPIALTEARFRRRLQAPDPLFAEARALDAALADEGGLYGWYDGDRYTRDLADQAITDDRPLLEYPELAERWTRARPAAAPGPPAGRADRP